MSYEKDKPYSSSSSGVDIPTPQTSNPPSPQTTTSTPAYATAPPSNSHQQSLLLLSAIYPATIILGGLFSLISPTGQNASYFSRKSNIFNILFVKAGWFWTTAAFGVLIYHSRHQTQQHRIKAAIRWALATASWVLVTQWCFGAPLMDRTFTITGGACVPDTEGYYTGARSSGDDSVSAKAEEAFTSAACKLAGGRWAGGHDLSGHTFMLTHASLFLWAELIPRVVEGRWKGKRNISGEGVGMKWFGVSWFVWAILGLWWWMLLMTSVYFHTWTEKLSGFAVALIEWGFLYLYLIPQNEQARQTVGVPSS